MNGLCEVMGGGHPHPASIFDHTKAKPMRKHLWKILLGLFLILGLVGYFRYYWVFGTGVKAGELNYVVHKGILFKTYEGKMIQTGIRNQAGTLQSFEFLFSISDPQVAQQLMEHSGNQFNLHYTEYNAVLPWRGNSKYVVDSIVSMDEVHR